MRDPKTSNREAELTAVTRIGSGDLLGVRRVMLQPIDASKDYGLRFWKNVKPYKQINHDHL
jgi:hypothetical protein